MKKLYSFVNGNELLFWTSTTAGPTSRQCVGLVASAFLSEAVINHQEVCEVLFRMKSRSTQRKMALLICGLFSKGIFIDPNTPLQLWILIALIECVLSQRGIIGYSGVYMYAYELLS